MPISQESIDRAVAIKKGAESLQKCEGYRDYLLPRIKQEMATLARKVLESDLSPESRESLRQRYLQLKEMQGWPDNDLKIVKAKLESGSSRPEL